MRTVYFMFGLPGAGKTTWIQNRLDNFFDPIIISADEIKKQNPLYNPAFPEALHQLSVERAEQQLINAAKSLKYSTIFFDGGGINNKYNARLMSEVDQIGEYQIVLVNIDTPLAVCLERNKQRERTVPESAIIKKAIIKNRCYHRLLEYCDDVVDVPYYTNKHIFFDMDGTLAAYQHMPLDENGNINFTDGEYFKYARPVQPVLDRILNRDNVYILSAMPNSQSLREKEEWLDKHAPFIPKENRFFVGNKRYKYVEALSIIRSRKLDKRDVTVVDDDHQVLTSLNQVGVNAIHISEFLTW